MGSLNNVAKTLYNFFNTFGNAYVRNTVPEGTKFPYLTYSLETEDYFTSGLMQVIVYSKSFSLWEITEIADKITDKIKHGFKLPLADGGYIYLMEGSPSCQFINDTDDITLKTALINIEYRLYT